LGGEAWGVDGGEGALVLVFLPTSRVIGWWWDVGVLTGFVMHADLEMLATDPKYQGQGTGSQLMRWGLERADQEGFEAYLEASPDAVRLYEHFGFREVARTDTWIENERVTPGTMYRNLFMIRPSKGAS